MRFVFPSWLLPWINLTIIAIAIYMVYRVFSHSGLTKKLTKILRSRLIKKDIVKPVSFEELLVATGGYGVSSIEICGDSPILDKTILQTNLRDKNINVLAIERDGEVIPNPKADIKMIIGDKVICFGKLEDIRNEICVIPK